MHRIKGTLFVSDVPRRIHMRMLISIMVISTFALGPTGTIAESHHSASLGNSPRTEVVARLWEYSHKTKTFDETRYVVNPMTMTLAAQVNPSTNFESLNGKRRQSNVEAYDRLQLHMKEIAASELDPLLVTAVNEIEKAKTWGKSPGDQLLISPDSRRLVLRPDMGTPVVVDMATLRTQRIVQHPDSLDIPVAWSPDSRRLAFAPSEDKEIVIFDVEHGAVESRLPGFWVQAIAWSPDMQTLALMTLVNRRLYKSPTGLVAAWAGHPDYRNDLVLEIREISNQERKVVPLKSNLDEQNPFDYWIEWK